METKFAHVTFGNVDDSGTAVSISINNSMEKDGDGVSGSLNFMVTYINPDGEETAMETDLRTGDDGGDIG